MVGADESTELCSYPLEECCYCNLMYTVHNVHGGPDGQFISQNRGRRFKVPLSDQNLGHSFFLGWRRNCSRMVFLNYISGYSLFYNYILDYTRGSAWVTRSYYFFEATFSIFGRPSEINKQMQRRWRLRAFLFQIWLWNAPKRLMMNNKRLTNKSTTLVLAFVGLASEWQLLSHLNGRRLKS